MGKVKRKRTNHDPGHPGEELHYKGEDRHERVKLTLIEFNENEFFEQHFYDLSECLNHVRGDMVKWLNVDGIHKIELIEAIGKKYHIHPLTLEDIVHTDQRPKFEDYDNYVVAMMKMIYFDNHIQSEQLSILLFPDLVISFQEPQGGDAFDLIRKRLREGKGRIRKMHADYLAYALIDAVVDSYFFTLEKIGEKIELLDEEIMNDHQRLASLKLHDLKREMIYLRKQIWPMREMVNNMMRSETTLIDSSTDVFLRDLHDHIVRIIDSIESYREMLAGIMDIYLSNNANKLNEVMKALTVISAIFIPVTFIAGVYGMNFKYMPELETKYGYWIAWGLMLTVMIGMGIYFKRKKWW